MESKRSCWASAICCGMPIQKACLVFSMINGIICILASLVSLGFLIIVLHSWFDGYSRGPNDMVLVYLIASISVGCCIATGIALTFAVVLFLGIRRNNERYVMSYFVYGIITVTLSALGTLGFVWWCTEFLSYALIPLGVSLLYSGMLVLVYQTYRVICEAEFSPATVQRKLLSSQYYC